MSCHDGGMNSRVTSHPYPWSSCPWPMFHSTTPRPLLLPLHLSLSHYPRPLFLPPTPTFYPKVTNHPTTPTTDTLIKHRLWYHPEPDIKENPLLFVVDAAVGMGVLGAPEGDGVVTPTIEVRRYGREEETCKRRRCVEWGLSEGKIEWEGVS